MRSSEETAVVASGTEPARYTPDALKDVNEQVALLKSRFEQEDYAGVLASAPATLAAARNLPAVAAARKAELHKLLEQEWANLSADVPKQIEAVRIHVDALAHQKILPAGITSARAVVTRSRTPAVHACPLRSPPSWDADNECAPRRSSSITANHRRLGRTSRVRPTAPGGHDARASAVPTPCRDGGGSLGSMTLRARTSGS